MRRNCFLLNSKNCYFVQNIYDFNNNFQINSEHNFEFEEEKNKEEIVLFMKNEENQNNLLLNQEKIDEEEHIMIEKMLIENNISKENNLQKSSIQYEINLNENYNNFLDSL